MKNIKTIHIENFRGIDSLEVLDCNRINVLIGRNNVGKSSILESIFLTTGMSNAQLPLSINMFRGATRYFQFEIFVSQYGDLPST